MKKVLSVILALIMCLSLCACAVQTPPTAQANCTHSWKPATCTESQICKLCGLSQGSPYGHQWSEATCTTPRECTICGLTQGATKNHQWSDASCNTAQKCVICGQTQGTAKGHQWNSATCTTPKTCTICGTSEGGKGEHKESSQGKCQYCNEDMLLLNVKENLVLTLIVPSVGSSKNYYCQVEYINRTGKDVLLASTIYPNGTFCTNSSAYEYVLESGYKCAIPYYRSILLEDRYKDKYKDMYLDNESLAWTTVRIDDTIVFIKFGTQGIVKVGYKASEIGEY